MQLPCPVVNIMSERKVEINLGIIKGRHHYTKIMGEAFSSPSNSENLNVLNEYMRDLSWFPEEKILIEVKNLERLREKNFKLYLIVKNSLELIEEYWSGSYERISDKEVFFIHS